MRDIPCCKHCTYYPRCRHGCIGNVCPRYRRGKSRGMLHIRPVTKIKVKPVKLW